MRTHIGRSPNDQFQGTRDIIAFKTASLPAATEEVLAQNFIPRAKLGPTAGAQVESALPDAGIMGGEDEDLDELLASGDLLEGEAR
jgi:hypothetical protein